MSERCPSCGVRYTASVTAGSNQNHKQVFGGRPHILFANYPRVCADGDAAETVIDGDPVSIDLYLHTSDDLAVLDEKQAPADE